jgi:hypothetical protein
MVGPNYRSLHETRGVLAPTTTTTMTREQITALVQQLGDITTALADADPTDRAEVYRQLDYDLPITQNNRKSAYRHKPSRTHMGIRFVSEDRH